MEVTDEAAPRIFRALANGRKVLYHADRIFLTATQGQKGKKE